MYDTKYSCRYHKNDVFLETDEVTDGEKDYIRTVMYREDLLHIFNIQDIEDIEDELNISFAFISELYNNLYNCQTLRECMRMAASKLMSEDENIGLCILYSFDFMHLTHKCVQSYLENGGISDEDISLLKDAL